MTPVGEKVVEERRDFTGRPDPEPPRSPGESREREGRRAGILLIIAGCVLMALAAGEASAATIPAGGLGGALHAGVQPEHAP